MPTIYSHSLQSISLLKADLPSIRTRLLPSLGHVDVTTPVSAGRGVLSTLRSMTKELLYDDDIYEDAVSACGVLREGATILSDTLCFFPFYLLGHGRFLSLLTPLIY